MKNPRFQQWPDSTLVRFTEEALEAMKPRPGSYKALSQPAAGATGIYTIDNTADGLHDVIRRETGERYGVVWLESVADNEDLTAAKGSAHPSWQRGNWMQTFTGRQFYPLAPRPEDIDIIDIAHALSMQCRYNGHVRHFYSVAQHCVLISSLVSPENALWALLHDATEAYVGDMIRPLKLHMPDYQAVENRVMLAIAEKFGIEPSMPPDVKAADSRILLDERDALMGEPAGDWAIDGDPFGIGIDPWPPSTAEVHYLHRFAELTRS